VIAGWYTAEVGRQPWIVYGLLRTSDAVTPSLTTATALMSLSVYVVVYLIVFGFGAHYIFRLLREGPQADVRSPRVTAGSRPMAFAGSEASTTGGDIRTRE
jgi:cytochrome d ubiquinol oxidase subunit I